MRLCSFLVCRCLCAVLLGSLRAVLQFSATIAQSTSRFLIRLLIRSVTRVQQDDADTCQLAQLPPAAVQLPRLGLPLQQQIGHRSGPRPQTGAGARCAPAPAPLSAGAPHGSRWWRETSAQPQWPLCCLHRAHLQSQKPCLHIDAVRKSEQAVLYYAGAGADVDASSAGFVSCDFHEPCSHLPPKRLAAVQGPVKPT